MTMTKRELVIRVANKLGMTQSDAAKIIEGTFDVLSKTLAEGKRWELRDFGVFEVKTRASRMGRNPRTGDQVPVPERRVVTFRPGKKMKELIATSKPGKRIEEPDTSPPDPTPPTAAPTSGENPEYRPPTM
jgi:integration host factor subunit beta